MKVWTVLLFIVFLSCTKEVKIDIPGYQNQLVVDGIIETGGHPIVLLSQSANIYEQSDLAAYISRFVYDAQLNVISGNDTFPLSLFTIAELPIKCIVRLPWLRKQTPPTPWKLSIKGNRSKEPLIYPIPLPWIQFTGNR